MRALPRPPLQTVSMGFVVAVVGFFSSFPIVIEGLSAMGASQSQTASGLMAAALSMGLTAIAISLWSRQPSSVAWSTPGVAFLATAAAPAGGLPEAIGAFVMAGVLTLLSGLIRPLRVAAASIPLPLAHAMLAGVLVAICIRPFLALPEAPQTVLPIALTWFAVARVSKLFAVPAAVLMALGLTLWHAGGTLPQGGALLTKPVFIAPAFSLAAALSLALPLWVITMATQNIPGMAVLKGEGYPPRSGPFLASVGLASVLTAPLAAPQTCLAAITSNMCAGEDSHPDPALRFWSAVFAGLFYCLFGVFSALIIALAAAAPPYTIETLAGLALLGVFAGSTSTALGDPQTCESAALTFLITASGVSIWGLTGAVWGLVIGLAAYGLTQRFPRA